MRTCNPAPVLRTLALVGMLLPSSAAAHVAPRAVAAAPQRPTTLAASAICSPDWVATFGGANGTSGTVAALAVYDDGHGPALYATGHFEFAGGVLANNIAKWDGSSWSALGGGLLDGWGTWTFVNAGGLAVFDDGSGPALFVGGALFFAGGVPVTGIAKWNGTTWSAVSSGVLGTAGALTVYDDGNGPALFAGGLFLSAGGTPANNIAKWNGSYWSKLGSGTQSYLGYLTPGVLALTVFDDGTGPALIAGGSFTGAGDVPCKFVARWDGSSWAPLGSGMNVDEVRALTVFDDGAGDALYAAGDFTKAGGVPANHVAKWNGTSWSALGSGLDWYASALAVFDDGSGSALYAAGGFTSAGGAPASRIAKWNGSSWSELGSGVDKPAQAFAVFDDGSGPGLYVGGSFDLAGGAAAESIAKWGYPLGAGGSTYCTAKKNSVGCTPTIHADGKASATCASPFRITADDVLNNKNGLLFYGTNGSQALAFQGGTLCVKAPIKRAPVQNSAGDPPPNNCSGAYSLDFNARIRSGVDSTLVAGATVSAQWWSRDPSAAFTTGLTDALRFTISP